jgi:type IV pilus assembly protein PilQ
MRSGSFVFHAIRGIPLLTLALLTFALPANAEPRRFAQATEVLSPGDHQRVQVIVHFDAPPSPMARFEKQNNRLIVDVPNAELSGKFPPLTPKDGVVAGVLTQAFTTSGSRTVRVLVTLHEAARYGIVPRGNDLVLSFEPGSYGVLDEPTRTAPNKPAKTEEVTRVDDIRFEHGKLEDRVVVRAFPPPTHASSSATSAGTRIVLDGASLPPQLARILDVGAYAGKLTKIATFSDPAQADRVILEVEHAPGTQHRLVREAGALVFEFYASADLPTSLTGVARDGGIARKVRTVSTEELSVNVPRIEEGLHVENSVVKEVATVPEAAQGVTPALFGQARDRYAGRRIDLDLKDADIHNVLRLLADVGHVNIITADNVTGSVTIRMRNVPWDQALDVILQAKNLGVVRQGNLLRVAPLTELEKEREMTIARLKQETQLAPVETRLIPVSYANAADVSRRARELLSERGSIAVDDRTNVMIVRDVAGNLNQIEELTRALDTQTPQVLVEARIVEATSRYLRDVGIQWGGDASFSPVTANPTGLAFPNSVGVVGGASDTNTPTAGLSPTANRVDNPNFAVNLPAAVGTGSGGAIGLTFGSIDNTINLALRLSAAEATGMVRILSSPRVLTLDNRDARIAQGTLIPFSQVSAMGVQTTFQEAKLQLLVRPHVTADGSVSMHVKINRDEPDFTQTSARGDPMILKREAETDLLVMDGHTAVIGGIYTRNTGRNLDQVPFFGDIPILGLLFQRRRASDQRGELVIFLTPRIVNRAEALGR